MSIRLQETFDRYKRLTDECLRHRPPPAREGVVRLVSDSNRPTREAVAAIEDTEAFRNLVAATRMAFHPQCSDRHQSLWEHAVKNFFRRSRLYVAARAGSALDNHASFELYTSAFQADDRAVTYLAPIEHVAFASDTLDLGSFQVRRFTRVDLERILQVDTNRVFYEWALTDIGPLDEYWYVVFSRTVERADPCRFAINFADIDRVAPTFGKFPELSEALLPLVCFPWQADNLRENPSENQEAWHGFRLAFVIVADNDLLKAPRSRPPIEQLDREPVLDSSTGEEMNFDRPTIWTSLDHVETHECEEFVRSIASGIRGLGSRAEWEFFERAGRYLLKAFFAEDFEQLLWHVTAVDALLGDDSRGSAKRLARRIAAILGSASTQQRAISERFRELYDFRSRFVHGAAIEKQALTGHLNEARETARALFVWFLAFLVHIQDVLHREALSTPARENLLRMIDLGGRETAEMETIRKMIATLPAGFPGVQAWLANTPSRSIGYADG